MHEIPVHVDMQLVCDKADNRKKPNNKHHKQKTRKGGGDADQFGCQTFLMMQRGKLARQYSLEPVAIMWQRTADKTHTHTHTQKKKHFTIPEPAKYQLPNRDCQWL